MGACRDEIQQPQSLLIGLNRFADGAYVVSESSQDGLLFVTYGQVRLSQSVAALDYLQRLHEHGCARGGPVVYDALKT